jgi:hypothetical protein
MTEEREDSASRSAGSLFVTITTLIGLCEGGYYGIAGYMAAVEHDVRRGGPGDYLPFGVPLLAGLGAVIGAVAGRLVLWAFRDGSDYSPKAEDRYR